MLEQVKLLKEIKLLEEIKLLKQIMLLEEIMLLIKSKLSRTDYLISLKYVPTKYELSKHLKNNSGLAVFVPICKSFRTKTISYFLRNICLNW